jgi:pyrimidine operon attenuation protein/uracil phosphoribosyltransferase
MQVKLKAELMDEAAMNRTLMRMAHEICEKNPGAEDLCLVGIRRRGEPLAAIIARDIQKIEGREIPCGGIDAHCYRDDLTQGCERPAREKPGLPFSVAGRLVILVDDVLYTGRTARAATEAVIACGRPRSIQLAVLVDRGHRELPIRADFVGKNIPTSRAEHIEVRIPPYDGAMQVRLMENSED